MIVEQIKAMWLYRGFIWGSVQREFQVRYRNSLLGSLWAVLNPLSTIVVYIVIFSQLMRARLPGTKDTLAYSIYLCSGILTWTVFAEIIQRCQSVFIDNANLIKKLNFPRICLPTIVILNAGVNFLISFSLFLFFLILVGKFPGWVICLIPLIFALQILFATGIGIIVGIVNVFFRDAGQLIGIILQFWFWFTPIVYPISVLPEIIQKLIKLNPMTLIISAYQSIILYKTPPEWLSLAPILVVSLTVCFLSIDLYRKKAGDIVDEL